MKLLKILNEWKGLIICVLLWALAIFLWTYNDMPNPFGDASLLDIAIIAVFIVSVLAFIWFACWYVIYKIPHLPFI